MAGLSSLSQDALALRVSSWDAVFKLEHVDAVRHVLLEDSKGLLQHLRQQLAGEFLEGLVLEVTLELLEFWLMASLAEELMNVASVRMLWRQGLLVDVSVVRCVLKRSTWEDKPRRELTEEMIRLARNRFRLLRGQGKPLDVVLGFGMNSGLSAPEQRERRPPPVAVELGVVQWVPE